MLKVIEIEGKNISFESNGRTLRLYRTYFNKDMLKSIVGLQKYIKNEKKLVENFDFSLIEELAWGCAYTADSSIPKIDDWLMQFESPMSLLNKTEDIINLLFGSMQTTVTSKKNIVPK